MKSQDWDVNWSVISMMAFVASEWMRSPGRVLGASKEEVSWEDILQGTANTLVFSFGSELILHLFGL